MIILGIILFGDGTYHLFAYSFGNNIEIDNTRPDIQFAKDRKYFNYICQT